MADVLLGPAASLFGGTWSTVWPLVLLPLAALAIVRGVPAGSAASWKDPRRQARLAAFAASVPAITALLLVAGFSSRGFGKPDTFTCVAKIYGAAFVFLLLCARSVSTFAVRRRRLGRPLSLAQPPSPRLARLASELGVAALEIPAEASLCFVAGLRRPRVLVSSGAVARLSDADLRAALLHERAHLRRSDGLMAAAVSLAAECGIRPPARALRLYRLAREAVADAEAARVVGGEAFAELLVRFARSSARVPAAVQLAEREHLALRVSLLLDKTRDAPLEDERAASHAGWRIAAALALSAYPFFARAMAAWIGRCG